VELGLALVDGQNWDQCKKVKGTVLLIESHQGKADEGQTFKNQLKTIEVIHKKLLLSNILGQLSY
jgi:hypothetical protein